MSEQGTTPAADSVAAATLPEQQSKQPLQEQKPQQEEEVEAMEDATFSVLVAPPQVTDESEMIRLDGVSAADTVLSLRQLLAEFPALACYTCFRLEVQAALVTEGQDEAGAVMWVPLNDFVELGEYETVAHGATLRMVLEKYDARKVRAHVRRFRDVLLNPPIPQTTDADVGATDDTASAEETSKQGKSKGNASTTPEPEKEAEQTNGEKQMTEKAKKEATEKQLQHLRKIHEKLEGVTIPVISDLGEFYSMPVGTSESQSDTEKNANKVLPAGKKKGGKKGGKKNGASGDSSTDPASSSNDEAMSLEAAKLPACVKSIVFSGYNPPPGPRKLAGDLLYLEVTTEDNAVYHITAHVDGFFVNNSTKTTFNPLPRSNASVEHLLLDVLRNSSPAFKKSYTSLLTKAAALAKQGPVSIELMVAAGNQVGGKLPWNTPQVTSGSRHEYNPNRAEDELCASFGMDERGVLRDWNEEYQCCRELPVDSLKEKIVRSRVMYKIVNEFVDAATQGAVAIVEGHIPPINPMDDASAHVYVFNNIFFSLSIDGKPATKDLTGEEAAFSSANRDLQGVKAFNEADVQGLHTLATAVVDYLGVRVIAQSVIPGILQGEAASKLVYGSVDGGKTIASNEKMHQLMLQASEKLHIAERSIEPLGKDESEVNEEVVTGGEASTAVVKLCGPVEAKGILGSDGRMYVLDLVRITPKDATFYGFAEKSDETTEPAKDADLPAFKRDDDGYVALLRPELVQLYSMWKQNQIRKAKKEERAKIKNEQSEQTEDGEKKDTEIATEVEKGDSTAEKSPEEEDEPIAPILLNPNVFMEYNASVDSDEARGDHDAARDAADYLQKVVIPAFVTDIRRGSISPADGYALSELMHACGINMRYLGRLATLAKKLEAFSGISKYALELFEVEMISRVVKHIVADELNKNDGVRAAPGATLVQLLNSVFGGWDEDVDSPLPSASNAKLSDSNPNKKSKKNKKKTKATNGSATDSNDAAGLGAEAVWQRIATQVKNRFGYSLALWNPYPSATNASKGSDDDSDSEGSSFKRAHKMVLLRRICQRLGLRVVSKSYDFSSETPFSLQDITGVVPVVKHSLPAHPLGHAKQLLERGRLHLSGGALATSYELLQEASSLLFQVVGGAHEDAALCSSSLATVLYHAGDVTGAISQQQRALALYTQIQGLDYHDTAFAHANLALFLHANSQTDVAVTHLRRAIYLLELCAGPHFPEISTLYLRMGSMCQDVGQVSLALLCYRESLHRGEFDRLQAANTLHQMALACTLVGGYRDALTYEQRVYTLLKEAFGAEDPRVLESAKFVSAFTERAVEGAKGRREVDAAAAADAIARELLDDEFVIKEETPVSKKKGGKKNKAGGKKHH